MKTVVADWKLVPLMDVVNVHDARRVPLNQSERSSRRGPFPYYGANGLVDSIDGYLFDGDFVLLAEDGGYFEEPSRGIAYEVSGKFWVNNHAHILSPKPTILRRFLTYSLNCLDWMPYVGGSTRLKLTQEGMRRVRIPLPSLGEQRDIVSKLDRAFSSAEGVRDDLARIPNLVERYKQSLLSRIFESLDGAEFRLGDLISSGPQNGLYLPKSCYGSGTPILRIDNFDFNEVESIDRWKRVVIPDEQIGRYNLEAGDLVVNRVNSPSHLGKSLLIGEKHVPSVFESNMMRFRVGGAVLPIFVQLFLISDHGRSLLTKGAKWAVNQASINQTDVGNTMIPVPDLQEQRDIVRRVGEIKMGLLSVLNEASRGDTLCIRLKGMILERALRGKLTREKSSLQPLLVSAE